MASRNDFKIFRSSAGFGLKALRDFKKGDRLVQYTGPKLTNKQADARPNKYLFRLDDRWTIDGSPRSNLARYINHACAPNAEAVHETDTNRIFIEARKRIRAGEEITYDYGREHFEAYIEPKGCRCAKCRDERGA